MAAIIPSNWDESNSFWDTVGAEWDEAATSALILYYVNLLIIQYYDKPKARAHINLIIGMLIASGVIFDVLNGYDIETAVGVQLDVLGKYAGVTRYWAQENLENYFAFTDYTEVNPDSLPKFGFCTYANYSAFSYNGTLTYDEIVETANALSDDDFRILIKIAIIQNTCSCGHGEIDRDIWNLFGGAIRPESFGDMKMFYFITTAITPLIQAIITKKLLPKAMAVLLTYVQQNSGQMFGFTGYDEIIQPFEYGFSDYANYDTTPGQCLTYNQIISGM